MTDFEYKTYGKDTCLEVDQPERMVDVLNYITTGYSAHSLDGVTWKIVDAPTTKNKLERNTWTVTAE